MTDRLDHRAFLAQLPPPTRAALTERADAPGLRHLAGHLGALGLTGTWIATGAPFWGLALLPHGVLLVFLFTLAHECTHHTPFRTPWLNRAAAHLAGLPLLLPPHWFRHFHLAHHRHTNDPARDPELAGGGRPRTPGALALYLSGWGYWSGGARVLAAHAAGRVSAPYLPPARHAAMIAEARAYLALCALAALSLIWSPLVLWLWVIPALLGQPVLRLYLLAEHGLCPPVADMFENSRTTLTARAIRWLAWNMPYHAEHHAAPNVPFHHLPALHAAARAHLKSTSPGYAAFTRDYLTALAR